MLTFQVVVAALLVFASDAFPIHRRRVISNAVAATAGDDGGGDDTYYNSGCPVVKSTDAVRRGFLLMSCATFFTTTGLPLPAAGEITTTGAPKASEGSSITVPLRYGKQLQELLIDYQVGDNVFRAILDTGSPFLMIPGPCGENSSRKYGCFENQGVPSGLEKTYEEFDGFEGEVEWRSAPFSFVDAIGITGPFMGPWIMTFGVASESIMKGPGGVFFGMIRDTDKWIRPSFLGQTSIQSFQINLLSNAMPRTLTLSTKAMITGNDYIQLTSDLRRRYGDPVSHYTVKVKEMMVNGCPLSGSGKPIYAIIDTGVTGMVISQELFTERYALRRKRKERNMWGDVKISFRTARGGTLSLTAAKPITTVFRPELVWKRFQNHAHVIVLGLALLDDNKLTIDIDKEKMWIETV